MASTISIIYCILTTVVIINVTESESILSPSSGVNSTSPGKAGRSKRSLSSRMPYLIQIEVKYEAEEVIKLFWTQASSYLANEHLPVIMPFSSSNPNIMNDIGEFILYHDQVECSAVVYFEKENAFYGTIGMKYLIEHLPFDFDEKGSHRLGVIGTPFVKKNDHPLVHIDPQLEPPPPFDMEAWADYLRSSDETIQNFKRPNTCEASTSAKRHRTKRDFNGRITEGLIDVYDDKNDTTKRIRRNGPLRMEHYLEILVFVTSDIVEIFEKFYGKDHYMESIVRYFIIYFNAVDVIFQKLTTNKVQLFINIATIVIEDVLTPFNFMTVGEVQFSEVVRKLPEYLDENRDFYTPDSFDHVFICTSRAIMDGVIRVNGLTKHGEDLFEARKHNIFYGVVPITAIEFKTHADYVAAVHEISRTFNIEIDPKEKGLKSTGQCYGIMQREGPKCDDCLKWSDDSRKQFEEFFSKNRNRCFLRNKPRSIRPPEVSRYLTPLQQCRCFGYDSYFPNMRGHARETVTKYGCTLPLRCSMADGIQPYDLSSVRPFDGTRCSNKKVCWNQQCVQVQLSQLNFES